MMNWLLYGWTWVYRCILPPSCILIILKKMASNHLPQPPPVFRRGREEVVKFVIGRPNILKKAEIGMTMRVINLLIFRYLKNTSSVVHVHKSDETFNQDFQVVKEQKLKLRFWWPIGVFCLVFSDCASQMWP